MPNGRLAVYSVDTEEEAERLLEAACELVFIRGENTTGYIAKELEAEQTLDNLRKFGERLELAHQRMRQTQKMAL